MCTSIQSLANCGIATISTPNSLLNGGGSMGTVLTGATTGTAINQIYIKAQGNTSEGMVRLFIFNGVNNLLYKEISIPASVQSSVEKAFEVVLAEDLLLQPGYVLKASTQNADTFNVIANGKTWIQCACGDTSSSCAAEPRKNTRTATMAVNTANPFLNGTGTLVPIITAQIATLNGGTIVNSVNIKATGNTSEGMIRLFIQNGATTTLLTEVPIAASTQTSIQPAYRTNATLGIFLNPGYSLVASTQNSDNFNVRADATEVLNCNC